MILPNSEVKKDLEPIFDVFGGADGGVSYARLCHGLLAGIYEKAEKTPTELALIKMVKQFSKLCKVALGE